MLRDLTSNTIRSYNSMLHSYLSWVATCQQTLEAISIDEIRAYLLFLKQSNALSNRTIIANILQNMCEVAW